MNEIPVFYSPDMLLDLRSSAPQALKPSIVVADWQARRMPIDLATPLDDHPMARLHRTHSQKYVRDVLRGNADNGFGTMDGELARNMLGPVDAMVTAAEYLNLAGKVACAPFGGFQHAHYSRAEAYCTFNGLVAAARELGRRGPVGILDFDAEVGNGTADILRRATLSNLTYVSAAESFRGPKQGVAFMAAIRSMVRQVIYAGCRAVVYQASVNQHISEPRIGMLTTAQMIERDRIVFSWFADAGVKVLWCLGGGHHGDGDGTLRTVVELHRNTMVQCIEVFTGRKFKPREAGYSGIQEAGAHPLYPYDSAAGRAFVVVLWLRRVCGILPKDVVPDDVYLLPEPVHLWRLLRTRLKVLEAMPQTKEIGLKAAIPRWMRAFLRAVPLRTREAFSEWVSKEPARPMDPRALFDVHRLLGARGSGEADALMAQIDRELRDKIAAGKAPASLLATRRWSPRS